MRLSVEYLIDDVPPWTLPSDFSHRRLALKCIDRAQ
jgi:hypothetical protein